MTEEFKNIIKEEISKLPVLVQNVLNNFDWVKITEEIGKKFSLSELEINNLQAETLIILVGVDYPDFYARNIENNVRTDKEKAEKISVEVFEKIFKPLREVVGEKIKNNMQGKEMSWDQSVDFILSGGDYTALLKDENSRHHSAETKKTDAILGSSNILKTKDRLIN